MSQQLFLSWHTLEISCQPFMVPYQTLNHGVSLLMLFPSCSQQKVDMPFNLFRDIPFWRNAYQQLLYWLIHYSYYPLITFIIQTNYFLSFFISFQVAMVSDNLIYPMQNTRGPGLMGCKTDTGQKHMLMQVRHGFSFCSSLKTNLRVLSNVMAFNLFTLSYTLDKLFKT